MVFMFNMVSTRRHILFGLAGLLASPAWAGGQVYSFDPTRSSVRFSYLLLGEWAHGAVDIDMAKTVIDLKRLDQSSINVNLAANTLRAGFFLATQTLRGPELLDATTFPAIVFESGRVTPTNFGALVDGQMQIKDIKRREQFEVRYLNVVPEPGDEEIGLQVTGQLNRHAYGVSAYSGIVGPDVALRIRLYLTKAIQ